MSARRSILKAAVRERVTYDLGGLRAPIAETFFGLGRAMLASGDPNRQAKALALLMRLHSGAFSESVDRRILAIIRDQLHGKGPGIGRGLQRLFEQLVADAVRTFRKGQNPDIRRLIGSRILVVKSWRPGERGVIVVDYSYVFPLMAGLFDLPAIAERYFLVLEPSWAGTCNPDILLYSQLKHPVFIETIEPRDAALLKSFDSNLETVPLAANWWVDHRLAPPPDGTRDIDVIMVAAWADIKRHWRVFRVLAALRRRGHRLKVALVGYQYDRTRADIEQLAEHYGIRDQVETFERLPTEGVAALLARSKVHVLWSRRECSNRAIVEAMFADVPIIVRQGLTFGFKYPYINDQTGRYVAESDLGEAIIDTIANRSRFSPRRWAMEHMTCEQATTVLGETIRARAQALGEPWTKGLVVKTSTLDTQRYWNPADRDAFAADYQFLESVSKSTPGRTA